MNLKIICAFCFIFILGVTAENLSNSLFETNDVNTSANVFTSSSGETIERILPSKLSIVFVAIQTIIFESEKL